MPVTRMRLFVPEIGMNARRTTGCWAFAISSPSRLDDSCWASSMHAWSRGSGCWAKSACMYGRLGLKVVDRDRHGYASVTRMKRCWAHACTEDKGCCSEIGILVRWTAMRTCWRDRHGMYVTLMKVVSEIGMHERSRGWRLYEIGMNTVTADEGYLAKSACLRRIKVAESTLHTGTSHFDEGYWARLASVTRMKRPRARSAACTVTRMKVCWARSALHARVTWHQGCWGLIRMNARSRI